MTSREILALVVVAVPALAAALRRARARAGSLGVALAARSRPRRPRSPSPIAGASRRARRSHDGIAIDAARRRCSSGSRRSSGWRACSSRPPTSARCTARSSAAAPARGSTSLLLYVFWAVLLAIPLAGNLGVAWLLVEASTAPSALLVGFSGKARALEAGWKYLVLTSLGLGVALLGIVILAAGLPRRDRRALLARLPTYTAGRAAGARSPTCCCSRAWPPRSAGRRSTTGCPTPIPRRQHRSPRCSRPRCCRPSARRLADEHALAPVSARTRHESS